MVSVRQLGNRHQFLVCRCSVEVWSRALPCSFPATEDSLQQSQQFQENRSPIWRKIPSQTFYDDNAESTAQIPVLISAPHTNIDTHQVFSHALITCGDQLTTSHCQLTICPSGFYQKEKKQEKLTPERPSWCEHIVVVAAAAEG